eukprot:4443959-Pleurochrysis_carterae.AAC.1
MANNNHTLSRRMLCLLPACYRIGEDEGEEAELSEDESESNNNSEVGEEETVSSSAAASRTQCVLLTASTHACTPFPMQKEG